MGEEHMEVGTQFQTAGATDMKARLPLTVWVVLMKKDFSKIRWDGYETLTRDKKADLEREFWK
jgi:hypothetical protein